MGQARYTVKQVAELTGVAPATLRAWERRYAVVDPQRSDSRYRLYDDADVRRLSRMAQLVRAGSPASLAATQVRDEASDREVPVEVSSADGPPVTDLILAAQRYDQTLLTGVLDRALAGASFEHALEGWLMPALTELGRAWERGEVDVASEHFVSATVQRRLSAAFDAAGLNEGAPVVLVGLPPGALHQLGALAFSVCLRRQGIDVRFLGADVPLQSWDHSVRTLRPSGVVVSVPMPRDASPAAELVSLLTGAHPAVRVWVGGHGTSTQAPDLALPPSAVEAARTVSRDLLRR